MKLNKETLKRIIKEEINSLLSEAPNTAIADALKEINSWGEENGEYTLNNSIESYIEEEMSEPNSTQMLDFAKAAGMELQGFIKVLRSLTEALGEIASWGEENGQYTLKSSIESYIEEEMSEPNSTQLREFASMAEMEPQDFIKVLSDISKDEQSDYD